MLEKAGAPIPDPRFSKDLPRTTLVHHVQGQGVRVQGVGGQRARGLPEKARGVDLVHRGGEEVMVKPWVGEVWG